MVGDPNRCTSFFGTGFALSLAFKVAEKTTMTDVSRKRNFHQITLWQREYDPALKFDVTMGI
jgi:hypothetical protein